MAKINGIEVSEEVLDEMERTKWQRTWKTFVKDWRLYALLVPLLVFMFLFKYLPIKGILMAFKDYNPNVDPTKMDWEGLVFVKRLFADTNFWTAFRNTFVNSMYGLLLGFPIPILLALQFSEIKNYGYRSILQVCSYLPKFMSTVVITTIITIWCKAVTVSAASGPMDIKGLMSIVFENFGWIEKQTPGALNANESILYQAKFFRPIYQVSGVWEGAGYGSIVYFAAILAISPTSYEAARIDGASKIQQIRYVTVPGMAPTLSIMLIMRVGHALNIGYEKVMLLYKDQTYETADVISTYVTRLRTETGSAQGTSYAIGIAADLMNAIIAMALVLGANAVSRKVSDTSLF
ncbi:MAG: ABC transporter permease subunit [Acholeplasmatales bacterium]|nr:ABC transporter permease subunit [Acholeplasmatales bacterium]